MRSEGSPLASAPSASRRLQPQGGQHRPQGVVLVGGRRAHQGHEAGAEEPAHRAAVAVHLVAGEVVEAAQQLVHRLGAQALGQGGRADDVAEQDRHLLALALRGPPGRRRLRARPAAPTAGGRRR